MSESLSSPFGTIVLSEDHQQNMLERLFGSETHKGPARNPRVPAVDVVETPNSFLVMVELPGIKKDDIEVKLSSGMLSISAESKSLNCDDCSWILHERRVGRYVRSVNLGRHIDQSAVAAKYVDGILELTISKPQSGRDEILKIDIA